jgi:hypothetical protein
MYGAEKGKPSFANNCLLARRLVERGVRFVNCYHGDWDHHSDVAGGVRARAEIDQACAALIKDLKQRGLLDETLVVWGGEFGRTPMVESSAALGRSMGRDHHPQAFTMWMAGGGAKAGITHGADGRHRLQHRARPRECPRSPGHHPLPARPEPHAPDLPLQGPRFPPHRRFRQRHPRAGGLMRPFHASCIALLMVASFAAPVRAQDTFLQRIQAAINEVARGLDYVGRKADELIGPGMAETRPRRTSRTSGQLTRSIPWARPQA